MPELDSTLTTLVTTTGNQMPSFKILSVSKDGGGKDIQGLKVASFVVQHRVNRISTANLYLISGDIGEGDKEKPALTDSSVAQALTSVIAGADAHEDHESGFPQSSLNTLAPGKQVRIQLGYDGKEDEVFDGLIVAQTISAKAGEPYMLCLELQHAAVKAAQVRQSMVFSDTRHSEIMRNLLGQFDLKGRWEDASASQVTYKKMVMNNVSAWDFLLTRAEASGCFVYTRGDSIIVEAPGVKANASVAITFGTNVYDFESTFETRRLYSEVKNTAWLPEDQEVSTTDGKPEKEFSQQASTAPDGGKVAKEFSSLPLHLTNGGSLERDEVSAWNKGALMRSHLSRIRARFVIKGRNDIQPGDTVMLEKFSTVFNGSAFVSGVTHNVFGGDWRTEVEIGVNPDCFSKYNDVVDEPVSGLIPPITGIQYGYIVQDENKNDDLYRVSVIIPCVDENVPVLARVAYPDAGSKHGVFFRPQPGDEVVVGFISEDPNQAIVLGALYTTGGQDRKPPLEGAEPYEQYGILTPSGIQVHLNNTDNIVTIATPDKRTFVLDDKEKKITLSDNGRSKNVMEFSDDGISITSKGAITMDATSFELTTKSGELSLTNATLTAKGKSMADLSAGQLMKIDGGTSIQIG